MEMMRTTVVVTLLALAGLVAASGGSAADSDRKAAGGSRLPSVSELKAQLLAAVEREAAKEEAASLSKPQAPESAVLPSAVGKVTLTSDLLSEYGQQQLAPIKYGERPDHVELALGLLPPCGGTCYYGFRRGYCSFWWTGCGWGRPVYHTHTCCQPYCICCTYHHLFGPRLAGSLAALNESLVP